MGEVKKCKKSRKDAQKANENFSGRYGFCCCCYYCSCYCSDLQQHQVLAGPLHINHSQTHTLQHYKRSYHTHTQVRMLLLQVLASATADNRLPAHEACGKQHVLPSLQTRLNAQQIIATTFCHTGTSRKMFWHAHSQSLICTCTYEQTHFLLLYHCVYLAR